MAGFRKEDFFLLIPKLKRIYLEWIKRRTKDNVANKLAWIYTFFTVMVLLVILGFIIHLGAIYKIPVIINISNFWGIKYLTGVEKFEVDIDNFRAKVGQTSNISFIVDSPEDVNAHFSIFFKSYQDPPNYVPSYTYEKSKVLYRGKTKMIINIKPYSRGDFELCIKIDDGTFFSINKYDRCPSTLIID